MRQFFRKIWEFLGRDHWLSNTIVYIGLILGLGVAGLVITRPFIFLSDFLLGFPGSDEERFSNGLILVFLVALVLWGLLWTYYRIFGKSPKP